MTEPLIHVCSLELMPATVENSGAEHLVSLINRDMMPDTPELIDTERHLKLTMNDIVMPTSGLTVPSSGHVRELVNFVERWPRRNAMVIHCWAGISRSTAAALITLSMLNPETPEREIALEIRSLSPTASPNRLMIESADSLLDRDGRLIDAAEDMGCGEIASRGVPFAIHADFEQWRSDSPSNSA